MKTMHKFLLLLLCSIGGMGHAQSDWTVKPFVIVNDSVYENVYHPVFIMDSTLYFRTSEGVVKTFPSRDVNYISKRCFYDRITPKEKNQLSRSITMTTMLGLGSLTGAIFAIRNNYLDYQSFIVHKVGTYSPGELFFGVGLMATSAVIIYRNIHRKRITKMIIESKGFKFIP
jgi:hypothetical protein